MNYSTTEFVTVNDVLRLFLLGIWTRIFGFPHHRIVDLDVLGAKNYCPTLGDFRFNAILGGVLLEATAEFVVYIIVGVLEKVRAAGAGARVELDFHAVVGHAAGLDRSVIASRAVQRGHRI